MRSTEPITLDVLTDPIVQLAALCPLCALAALDPAAALAAVSPVLRIFNPAINPRAALLALSLDPKRQVHNRVYRRMYELRTARM